MNDIPQSIKKYIRGQTYTQNNIGMSGSRVLVFPAYVLKIQEHTEETDNERNMIRWLQGRLPVPELLAYEVKGPTAYTLMSRVKGTMLCDEIWLGEPQKLISLAAEGLKLLWSIDIRDCPYKVSRLKERLKAARRNVEQGLVDVDNTEPETFGPGGFSGPEELLLWLEENQPEEDLVLTHGDFCLPNIFADQGHISGFIDLGRMGPADRWQDVALLLRSLRHNLRGMYSGGKVWYAFEERMLLEALGIPMDEEKDRYYMLLDELF